MKSVVLSLAACMALGSKVKYRTCSNAAKVPKVHYDKTLVYPQELVPYVEEYCGHFEELAQDMIDEYGGEDY